MHKTSLLLLITGMCSKNKCGLLTKIKFEKNVGSSLTVILSLTKSDSDSVCFHLLLEGKIVLTFHPRRGPLCGKSPGYS